MAAALILLLIGSLLHGGLCGQFEAIIPQTIEVLSGSCVTIPCSFDIKDSFKSYLDSTCTAVWKTYNGTVMFNSSNPKQSAIKGKLIGDLTKKDCTTILNNMLPVHSDKYFFNLDCKKPLKFNFRSQILNISVKADPPRPTVTPSTLKVEEGTSVTLSCSAPAPCLSHPPDLTWTSGLGDTQETLQENQDKTKVKTSVLNFTASHLHHGEKISCTAAYKKQDGSTESAVSTSLTADISYRDQNCGPYGGVLLLAVAGVSLSVNVLYTVCVVFLCKARKKVKPKEEDRTYMSLGHIDRSPDYDVIAPRRRDLK